MILFPSCLVILQDEVNRVSLSAGNLDPPENGLEGLAQVQSKESEKQ